MSDSTNISFNLTDNEKISLPKTINANLEDKHVREYTPQVLKQLLLNIANKPDTPIKEICRENGISDAALYTWMLYNSEVERAYFICKRVRSAGKVDILDETYTEICKEMDDIKENDKVKLRKIDLKTRLYRVNSLNVQWSASKLHKEYRDRQEIEHKGLDPVASRVAAWQGIQADEGRYEEVKDDKEKEDK